MEPAVINHRLAGYLSKSELDSLIQREIAEVNRRILRYRGTRPLIPVRGREVLLVDDGVATGLTSIAAARALRAQGAKRVVLAAPVCPAGADEVLGEEFAQVVCVLQPADLMAIGLWYLDFSPTTDEEVIRLLEAARHQDAVPAVEVEIPADGVVLPGDLAVPVAPVGIVLFAHGSGSSRKSPRNVQVAQSLNRTGLATLLFDLQQAECGEVGSPTSGNDRGDAARARAGCGPQGSRRAGAGAEVADGQPAGLRLSAHPTGRRQQAPGQ
jgi:hypothetical protein